MKRALCPQCGKPMIWYASFKHWDCGPESEGGHGYWDPEVNTFDYEEST